MGKMDLATKAYMRDNRVFADVVNFYFYGGEPHVDPRDLREMDPGEMAFFDQESKPRSMERHRDVLKFMVGKRSEEGAVILFGIENQTQIDYSMPVRTMLYDALQYDQQVEALLDGREKKPSGKKGSRSIIPRLSAEDRLVPVTTLTVYYGAEPWEGHRDLHSMLRIPPGMEDLVENYRLNLICPAEIADEDFDRFHTNLGKALKVFKYANNATELLKMAGSDPTYRSLDRKTFRLIRNVLDSRIAIPEGRGKVDMCKAIDDLIAQGEERGIEKNQNEMFERILGMFRKNILTLVQAAECLGMSEAEFKVKAGL